MLPSPSGLFSYSAMDVRKYLWNHTRLSPSIVLKKNWNIGTIKLFDLLICHGLHLNRSRSLQFWTEAEACTMDTVAINVLNNRLTWDSAWEQWVIRKIGKLRNMQYLQYMHKFVFDINCKYINWAFDISLGPSIWFLLSGSTGNFKLS